MGVFVIFNRTESSITDSNGTRIWSFGYDNRNRLSTETKPDGSTLSYLYDAAGNKSQLITTLVDGTTETISYTYDVLNRLETVTNSQGTSSYGYDAVGNRASLSYPNGASQTWGYDTRNRLTNTSIYNASGALIQSFDYTLHPTGRRTKITELDGRTSDYTYNSLYWLTGETIADAVNGDYNASYLYDNVGNRIQGTEAGVTTQYSYDANDRITQQGGVTYTYDANGNTLVEDDQGAVTVYGYNSQNQMVENIAGGFVTNYQYNADGIRHGQSDSIASTSYLVDANRSYAQVLAESVNGTLDVAYHYGDDLISQTRAGDSSFFHVDGLGSTRVLTDSAGSQTDSYGYAAFGEVLAQDGVTANSYLYTGEQYDAGLDQYYLRARYYDQGVGRFRQMDTWMGYNDEPISQNKYMYANVDPADMYDPTGNFALGFSFAPVSTIGLRFAAPAIGLSALGVVSQGQSLPNTDRRWGLWDVIAGTQFRAKAVTIGQENSSARTKAKELSTASEPPHGHHTVPIFLCGRLVQRMSFLDASNHRVLHSQLALMRIAKTAAESRADKMLPTVGRRRDRTKLRLAETKPGRIMIANTLSRFYQGGWWNQGTPTIGSVFPAEKRLYIANRENTSLDTVCKR